MTWKRYDPFTPPMNTFGYSLAGSVLCCLLALLGFEHPGHFAASTMQSAIDGRLWPIADT